MTIYFIIIIIRLLYIIKPSLSTRSTVSNTYSARHAPCRVLNKVELAIIAMNFLITTITITIE